MNKRTSILVQPQELGKNILNEIQIASLDANYDESAAITSISVTSTQVDLKIGDKINIAGQSLEINADASAGGKNLTIVSITLTSPILIGNEIRINEENLFEQYQRKTEGTVAGFDIDADGMSKGGVEITGWLDSDTMTGATANNVPTAESVKAYVDASAGGTTPTLQEVTDAGNTTTNSIIMPSGGTGIVGPNNFELISLYSNRGRITLNSTTASTSSPQISFKTDGNTRMVVTKGGNVGIGTTSPGQKLEVNGNAVVKGNMMLGSWASGEYITRTGSPYRLGLFTNSVERISVINSGNVGIGTTAPEEKLSVSGNIRRVAIRGNEDADWIMFKTDNSERMRLTNTGLGIGTTAPSEKLEVNEGYILSSGSGTSHGFELERTGYDIYQIRHLDGGLTINNATDGRKEMTFDGDGNVGIGTTAPGEKLHVVGDTKIDGGLKATAANIDFTGLGTTDPILQGRLWNDGGTLKISAG